MIKLILPVLLAGLLSACAAQPRKPPVIAYDGSSFLSAYAEPQTTPPVQVVEKPVPLPLPGRKSLISQVAVLLLFGAMEPPGTSIAAL